MIKQVSFLIAFGIILLNFFSCSRPTEDRGTSFETADLKKENSESKLLSIHIVDGNGYSETIRSKERLKNYDKSDFLDSSSYQKIFRLYEKDRNGHSPSVVTSYYENGLIKQYLEGLDGRACGRFIEWHSNGKRKLQVRVLSGTLDLDEKSKMTWMFDGPSFAYNLQGNVIAHIPYSKGFIEGTTQFFYENGKLEREALFTRGKRHGTECIWDSKGMLLERTEFRDDERDGPSIGYYPGTSTVAWVEEWNRGLLQSAEYFDQNSLVLATIQDGNGNRCIFDEFGLSETHEYKNGKQEGEVLIFDADNTILRRTCFKDGLKQGEELYYWNNVKDASLPNPLPKLSISWNKGVIQGIVKTWYDNGIQESQKEMNQNEKHGLLTAWYRDGSLMMIEEYEHGKLKRGDYHKKGEVVAYSRIRDNKGFATLFDSEGHFLQKVQYQDGIPSDNEV